MQFQAASGSSLEAVCIATRMSKCGITRRAVMAQRTFSREFPEAARHGKHLGDARSFGCAQDLGSRLRRLLNASTSTAPSVASLPQSRSALPRMKGFLWREAMVSSAVLRLAALYHTVTWPQSAIRLGPIAPRRWLFSGRATRLQSSRAQFVRRDGYGSTSVSGSPTPP